MTEHMPIASYPPWAVSAINQFAGGIEKIIAVVGVLAKNGSYTAISYSRGREYSALLRRNYAGIRPSIENKCA